VVVKIAVHIDQDVKKGDLLFHLDKQVSTKKIFLD